MKEWFTIAELAEAKLPNLPNSAKAFYRVVQKLGWQADPTKFRKQAGREGGGGFEYHYSLLSPPARARLAFDQSPDHRGDAWVDDRSSQLWARFEALPDVHKDVCRTRLALLIEIDEMRAAGIKFEQVLSYCLGKAGVSRATYFEWRNMVNGAARADWLAALAPSFASRSSDFNPDLAACHPDAWAFLKSDYLRPEKPGFSACYRRMAKVAATKDWSPLPSERSLRRRMEAEVPKAAQVMAREGKRKAAQLYPAQTRSKMHLHAMEIVNTDGHKLDLFVNAPWSAEPCRVTLLGIQDVYSGKVLSWRLCEAETWDAVRSTIGDMIENEGGKLPYHLYMDNGRAFASKKISGGAKSRHRFKTTEDEIAGLLTTLGIEPHFTKPYSGQSKPIERAWRDLAEEISKHPRMAGCYTGNSPDGKPENYGKRAIDLAILQEHVAEMIAEHNARPGRRSEVTNGRSFNETFDASIRHPSTIIRYATKAQRSLWLLTAETVLARKPSGSIHYLGNQYWAPVLNQWIGKKLTIRFDPAKLHEPIKVYDPAGRFLCDAECTDRAGFNEVAKAGRHERNRRTYNKHSKAIADLHRQLSPEQLGDILDTGKRAQEKPAPVRPAVTRLAFGNVAQAVPADMISDDEFEASFTRGLALMAGEGSPIIPFPSGKKQPARSADGRKTRAE